MLFQKKLIERVKNKCELDNHIASALMYGSFTKGEGDQYSDVEFYIFIKNQMNANFDSNNWIKELFPVELIFFNEYGTQVAIFSNLVRGEFHFLPEQKMGVIKDFKPTGVFPNPEKMFIYDSTNKLFPLLEYLNGDDPIRKTDENINFAFNSFVNYWIFGINVLKRGEYARSLEILNGVQKQILQLMRIQEDTVERWLNATKNLEKDLSKRSYEKFRAITANLNEKSIKQAYTNSIILAESLHVDLSKEYTVGIEQRLLSQLHTLLID